MSSVAIVVFAFAYNMGKTYEKLNDRKVQSRGIITFKMAQIMFKIEASDANLSTITVFSLLQFLEICKFIYTHKI